MHKYLSIVKDLDRAKKFFENFVAYTIDSYELEQMTKEKLNSFNLVDVRTYDDYTNGHIPFAEHLPLEQIPEALKILDKEKPTIIYSYDICCNLAKHAALILLEHKYPVIELIGGFKAWKKHGFDIIKIDSNI